MKLNKIKTDIEQERILDVYYSADYGEDASLKHVIKRYALVNHGIEDIKLSFEVKIEPRYYEYISHHAPHTKKRMQLPTYYRVIVEIEEDKHKHLSYKLGNEMRRLFSNDIQFRVEGEKEQDK
jgi:hypothetical protein